MKILKEDIVNDSNYSLSGELNFIDKTTGDALVKSINEVNFFVKLLKIDSENFILKLNVDSNVTYLDAKNLNELDLEIDFDQDIPFSFNEKQAKEDDVDFFDKELDIEQLIFELIMVYVPFNYSEDKSLNALTEDDFYSETNKPFANTFKKEE